MPLHRIRFELIPELNDRLTTGVNFPVVIRPQAYPAALRRALAAGSGRVRARGFVVAPLCGLRLRVYRTVLFGDTYEIVTRGGSRARVVGIVPIRRWRTVRRPLWQTEVEPSPAAELLSEHEAQLLALELLGADTEDELDQFLGKVFSKIGKLASGVARGVSKVGASLGKVIDGINKVVPIKAIWNLGPIGMASRLAKSVGRIAKGENVFKVAGNFVKSGLKDAGQAVQLASTVASFVPGIGTGVSAALGAAGALAQGRPITEALLAAARSALPGGALAATAFDVASQLVQGKSIGEAALAAARNQLPGGKAAQAAFDAGLALARGKSLQQVAIGTAGKLLPASPFASSALDFAQKIGRGARVQDAALSTAGGAILNRVTKGTRPASPRIRQPAPPRGVARPHDARQHVSNFVN